MHGQPNIKICSAKQAKQIFKYKKIKIKLYKNNAAIWYNKKSFLSGCTRQSSAESDDTRGCICTICVIDLLMMSGLRSKHVEEFNVCCMFSSG
jgi:hypothetical protein